ncbi:hypothetical protein HIM_04941 [Hirsutella minnesotensis 3608]|uniref:DUF7702 domain-containing protein n=1 Tax=Hirsutella minnesotensis 3608 TaxID=1043627 RepID=A0A0F8A5R4_9HYPO|nr:hypothetical protein HIM_04941 [Hirsutella minnesotensis 3608]
MDSAHRASAIAQIIVYAPTVPVTLYVGVRVWKYGPRLAWFPAMVFACARLTGGVLMLASQNDPKNTSLLTATIVLLNIGLVLLILPLHALTRIVLHANFPDHGRKKLFLIVTRILLLISVILLSAAGGLNGSPHRANVQSMLSKIAYFEFTFVLLALMSTATWLYFFEQQKIQDGQMIYIKWLLIASPILCVRAAFGIIEVFKAAGKNVLTSIWSPMFGNAVLFSLMALLPEFIVLCVFIYLGHYRYSTANQYGLLARAGWFKKQDKTKTAAVPV